MLFRSGRYRFVRGSILDADAVADAAEGCAAIVNFAAESHVDRSIEEPGIFLDTNVQGARMLMDYVRTAYLPAAGAIPCEMRGTALSQVGLQG